MKQFCVMLKARSLLTDGKKQCDKRKQSMNQLVYRSLVMG